MGNKPDPLPELPPAPEQAQAGAPGNPENKGFFTNGALKGLAVTAALFVAVMGIVFGAMGTGDIGTLHVDGNLATTFAEGLGGGIAKASEFLVSSWIGAATLAAGAALGIAHEYKAQSKQGTVAPDTEAHTKIRELTEALEVEKTVNQQLTTTIQEKELAPAKDAAPEAENKKDGIYLAGSVIENSKFRAGELKRRSEVTASASVERTV